MLNARTGLGVLSPQVSWVFNLRFHSCLEAGSHSTLHPHPPITWRLIPQAHTMPEGQCHRPGGKSQNEFLENYTD